MASLDNLLSNKVFVFPNAERAAAYPTIQIGESITINNLLARKMTEENIVNIVKSSSDFGSYVLSSSYGGGDLEFVIGGYYFKANGITAGSTSFIVAEIEIEDNNGYSELKGQDNSATESGQTVWRYNGLKLSTSSEAVTNDSTHLTILKVTVENDTKTYEIPLTSRQRFTPDRLDFSQIAYIGGITVS